MVVRQFSRNAMTTFGFGTLSAMAFFAGLVLVFSPANSSAKEPLGRKWNPSEMVSMTTVDHSEYDRLLKTYVDRDGYVDYKKWHATSSDRKALQSYLAGLSQASHSKPATKPAQLVFWINAYNAVTLEGILREYPTKSIRDHTSVIGGYNIWKDLPLLVGNRTYNLDSIEHKVLRKMKEPRIHFAIVCASIGCPRLLNEAYTADQLEKQLTKNTTDFFSRSQNLQADSQSSTLRLSAILDWFGKDFGSTQTQRLNYLKPYFPDDAQSLASKRTVRVKYLKYDWTLNDTRNKK